MPAMNLKTFATFAKCCSIVTVAALLLAAGGCSNKNKGATAQATDSDKAALNPTVTDLGPAPAPTYSQDTFTPVPAPAAAPAYEPAYTQTPAPVTPVSAPAAGSTGSTGSTHVVRQGDTF